MASQPPTGGEGRHGRARIAAAALFLTNGALFANLLPRLPEIKADLDMSNAAYGAAVASFSVGALLAGLTAGALVRRFQSARVAVATTVALATLIVIAGVAATPLAFAAALLFAGACDAITDVAQNVNGLRLQRDYGRSIINSLHAIWAVGAILGGLMGAAAIALHIPRGIHLGFAAVLFCGVVVGAYPHLLRGPDHDGHPATQNDGGAKAGGLSTSRWRPWWELPWRVRRSKTPARRGPPFICETAWVPPGPSRRSATSPSSGSCSSAG